MAPDYDSESIEALEGEPGWTGNYGWKLTEIDISEYCGQKIQLKWVFGSYPDQDGGKEGVAIDDLQIYCRTSN